MNQRIAHIAPVVKAYDQAIRFFTKTLGFLLLGDRKIDDLKRWAVIATTGAKECCA